ncbi:RluA family pseudouridine synthase [Brevibacillus halotolerans]|uniref:RluA family pseudouridine synthase n=1 Tax=Brevibacillus halotolerans TaxID=1507437 RepID=UPI0015EF289A|nr:RluA family pseudouridine synthase [Brevibacillus halotolerans]MBA4531763.1 RluA family pseudouridine synthase [Brevibacillus halotolerans]
MTMKRWLDHTVDDQEKGMTVEEIVRQKMSVSGRMLQRLTRSKGILVNRKVPFLKRQVKAGDVISVRIFDDKREQEALVMLPPAPFEIQLEVLYEDEYFIVVNKPTGMTTHPIREDQHDTLLNQLVLYWHKQGKSIMPHTVHRLDRETSGTILIAKSSYAHQLADKLIREGSVERNYVAFVTGRIQPESGTIAEPIKRDPMHKVKRQVHPKGEEAVTHYKVLASNDEVSLVDITLDTGRTHQIRVHFEYMGHPLVGDTLYRGSRMGFSNQALHAYQLCFKHPVTEELLEIKAPMPPKMKRFVEDRFFLPNFML